MEKVDDAKGRQEMLIHSEHELQELNLMKITRKMLEKDAIDDKEKTLMFTDDTTKSLIERLLKNFLKTRDSFIHLDKILCVYNYDYEKGIFTDNFIKKDLVDDITLFLENGHVFYHFEVVETNDTNIQYTVGVCKTEKKAMSMTNLNTKHHEIHKVYKNKEGNMHTVRIYPFRSKYKILVKE